MGFETIKENKMKKQNLWFETSLWDLKLNDLIKVLGDCPFVRNLPMGFETYRYSHLILLSIWFETSLWDLKLF